MTATTRLHHPLCAIRRLATRRTDPTTGRYLSSYHFIHNDNLRKAIEDWVAARLEHEKQQQQQQDELQEQQQQHGQLGHANGHATPVSATPHARPLAHRHATTSPGTGGAPALGRTQGGPGGSSTPVFRTPGGGTPPGGGKYAPVAGPGPGQVSVCVGTSEGALGLYSLRGARGRGMGTGEGMRSPLRGRSKSRPRTRSRGLLGEEGNGQGDWEGGEGNAGQAAARQVVRRAVSRRRGARGGGGEEVQ